MSNEFEEKVELPTLEGDYEDFSDPITVPPGEYDLIVKDVKYMVSRNGNPMFIINFEIMNEPTALPVAHFLMLPQPEDDERTKYQRGLAIKRFCLATGINTKDPVLSESIGTVVSAILSERTNKDTKEITNSISKFILG